MKRSIFTGILLMTAVTIFGQSTSDTIEIRYGFGPVFVQNNRKLTPKELMGITYSNPEAYNEMIIAKRNADASSVFGGIGGFMVGWPIGAAIGGGEPNWAMAAIGGGLILISIPFSTGYSKRAKRAVKIYNNDIKQTSTRKFDFDMGFTCDGIGFRITF